jgi:hypothetical protein
MTSVNYVNELHLTLQCVTYWTSLDLLLLLYSSRSQNVVRDILTGDPRFYFCLLFKSKRENIVLNGFNTSQSLFICNNDTIRCR